MVLPSIAPNHAPSTPAIANAAAQRHFTLRLRAWLVRPISALAAPASALVPLAACRSRTPTRQTMSGTARLEPPTPTSPRVTQTTPPERQDPTTEGEGKGE